MLKTLYISDLDGTLLDIRASLRMTAFLKYLELPDKRQFGDKLTKADSLIAPLFAQPVPHHGGAGAAHLPAEIAVPFPLAESADVVRQLLPALSLLGFQH